VELPPNLTEVSSSIIQYGNFEGNDVDLLSVAKGNCGFKHEIEGKWDLVVIGRKRFLRMLEHFDPVATEPVLTGDELHGHDLPSWKQQLLQDQATADDVDYLYFTSGIFLDWTKEHIRLKSPFEHIWLTLVFSLSFNLFAEYYRENHNVVTLSKLLEGDSLGISLLKKMREKRHEPREVRQSLVENSLGLLLSS